MENMAGSLNRKRSSTPRSGDSTKRKRARGNAKAEGDSTLPNFPVPAASYPFHFPSRDSGVTAQRAFQWLVRPSPVSDFLKHTFEKMPALYRCPGPDERSRFESLVSVDDMKRLVCSNPKPLRYGYDLDVTHYVPENGRRNLNGAVGTAVGDEAWDKFRTASCSIRLLRPQEFFDPLWALCSMLETFFGSVIGANVYLTPSNSQGFAPHFDDIDAFVCQVSGRKRWRVYAPRGDGHDSLPRRSSVDFTEEEMNSVPVLHDTVLEPGDLLYLPRGTIHQAECPDVSVGDGRTGTTGHDCQNSSLHVTVSACQQSTWADFLSETLVSAVESTSHEALRLRQALPLRFTDYTGVGFADVNEARRSAFDANLRKSLLAVANSYPIDAAADVLAARFMRERLPPWEVSLVASKKLQSQHAALSGRTEQERWIRATGRGIGRVVMDKAGELPRLVHCLKNSRGAARVDRDGILSDQETRRDCMSCTAEEAQAIDFLLKAYPRAVRVRDLPLETERDRADLAEILIDIGLGSFSE